MLGKSFCISGFLYELILDIEKSSTVTYTSFAFFRLYNMYTFLHKKKNQLSIEMFFSTSLIYMFGSKHLDNKTVDYHVHQLVLCYLFVK